MTKDSYQEPGLCPIMSSDFFLYLSIFHLEIPGVSVCAFALHIAIGCKCEKTTNIVSFCGYLIEISWKIPEACEFLRIKQKEYWEFACRLIILLASLVAQMVKNPPAMQETRVRSLGWEDLLEKGMATYSSILAWRIPWTEEPGRLSPGGHKESGTLELLTLYSFTSRHLYCGHILCTQEEGEVNILVFPEGTTLFPS